MKMMTKRGVGYDLELISTAFTERAGSRMLSTDAQETAPHVSRAARTFFEMLETRAVAGRSSRKRAKEGPPPALFRDTSRGLLRMVYKEAVIRFRKGTPAKRRKQILDHFGFAVRSKNAFVPNQFVVYARDPDRMGPGVIDVANGWLEMEEVEFSTPNFVSEYRRFAAKSSLPTIRKEQWHLENRAYYPGQISDEDVDARKAWRRTLGKRSISVAVIDDGVDVDHPNLKRNILKNPDPNDPRDKYGRDFYVPDDGPDHYDPRPKVYTHPYDELEGNDIHGTPCAGVIAGDGRGGPVGVAPRCRILPVKVFHADYMASDARVADAIRYAAVFSDVLSCSWGGGPSDDVETAMEDARTIGRGGIGAAVFCAAGNEYPHGVSFPADLGTTIAVAASTDQARRAPYSCTGPEVTLAAPSSGGKRGITTTDVSTPNRGFDLLSPVTEDFGGTSSATPLAAGIAALLLSIDKNLGPDEIRDILTRTAEKIGPRSSYTDGFSEEFGYGRVNAGSALEEV